MKPKLILMCGLARSGKSTWIKNNVTSEIIVCPDEIRSKIFGHQFHALANKFVFGIAEGMTAILLEQGKSVIIDATNITQSSRKSWKYIAENYNADPFVVWVYSSKDPVKNLRGCLEKNQLSPKGEKLPMRVLLRMAETFEEPHEDWFKLIEFQNPHRRKLPKDKRIVIESCDGLSEIVKKGEELWGVAEDPLSKKD